MDVYMYTSPIDLVEIGTRINTDYTRTGMEEHVKTDRGISYFLFIERNVKFHEYVDSLETI